MSFHVFIVVLAFQQDECFCFFFFPLSFAPFFFFSPERNLSASSFADLDSRNKNGPASVCSQPIRAQDDASLESRQPMAAPAADSRLTPCCDGQETHFIQNTTLTVIEHYLVDLKNPKG